MLWPGQVLDELPARSRPLARFGTHGPANGPVDALRQFGHQLARRRQIVVDLLHPGVHRPAAVERQLARHQLIQRGPQRIDIAADVGVLGVAELLGSHEVRRAQPAARARQVQVGFEFLDQAQIGQFRLAVLR